MKVTNPANEESREIECSEISSIPEKISEAKKVQVEWNLLSLDDRISCIRKCISTIEENSELLAKTIKVDMGKTISSARGEVSSILNLAKMYCEKASEWLEPEKYENGYIHQAPLGVVGVITPWNYPVYVSLTGIIPALISGNAVIYKPSEYTLETGIELANCINKDLPKGLLQIVVGGKEHGKALVEADVEMIAFTGSTVAGKHIMENCAKGIKRVHLELGGMDAAVVLKDADIEKAANGIVQANCTNSGQICCAAKRVYVEEEVYGKFVDAAIVASKAMTFGDPDTEVKMGPLVAKFQQEKVASIVNDAKEKGATIHTGGEVPQMKGCYYPSTIITDVTKEMRILSEEPFGPVLPIVSVKSMEQAVMEANDSPYGLTASVWTEDVKGKGQEVASKLNAGQVGINAHANPPMGAPFGGAKQSGIGRTASKEGMLCFCNTKFVYAV